MAVGDRARWSRRMIKSGCGATLLARAAALGVMDLEDAAANRSQEGRLSMRGSCKARGLPAADRIRVLQRRTKDGGPARPEPIQDGAHQDRSKVEREDADRPQHRQLRLLRLAAPDAAALLNHHCEWTQHKRRSVSQRVSAGLTSTEDRHSLACPVQSINGHCCEGCWRING